MQVSACRSHVPGPGPGPVQAAGGATPQPVPSRHVTTAEGQPRCRARLAWAAAARGARRPWPCPDADPPGRDERREQGCLVASGGGARGARDRGRDDGERRAHAKNHAQRICKIPELRSGQRTWRGKARARITTTASPHPRARAKDRSRTHVHTTHTRHKAQSQPVYYLCMIQKGSRVAAREHVFQHSAEERNMEQHSRGKRR